jgi:hypothetical protein
MLIAYLAIQLAFIAWADNCRPGIYDPEYEGRLRILEQRRSERPDQPVLLVLGSSRSVSAFRPELLPPIESDAGQELLAFNFAHTYAGPSYMYLTYRRLLEKGIVPRWIVLEIMPSLAKKQHKAVYTGSIVASEFEWLVGHHETGDLVVEYFKARALPWERLRSPIMHNYLSCIDVSQRNFAVYADYDRLGGIKMSPEIKADPEVVAQQVRAPNASGAHSMLTFKPDPRGERSLRALFDLCRQHGTQVAIILSSESPAFRERYTPEAYRQIGEHYRQVADEFGAPFVDAREWLDETDFSDGSHAVYSGQVKFTERIAEVLIRKWVRQKDKDPNSYNLDGR